MDGSTLNILALRTTMKANPLTVSRRFFIFISTLHFLYFSPAIFLIIIFLKIFYSSNLIWKKLIANALCWPTSQPFYVVYIIFSTYLGLSLLCPH